ncbi:sigma-70 family RNA polymerase sigma factor [bacterium]|nr:sigma-70 family RNA polymerase sigma factor [bacterium]
MDSYAKLQESLQKPNLTTEQLEHLLAQVGSDQEAEAVAKIIDSYQKMVLKIAQSVFANVRKHIVGASLLDFVQQGDIALWKAIITYNPRKGAFTSYAERGILSAITRLVENTSGVVRKPARFHERWRKLHKQKVLSDLEVEELARMDEAINEVIVEQEFVVEAAASAESSENDFLSLVEASLSKRHADVLRARLDGFSNTAIAKKLGYSRKTVIALFNDIKGDSKSLSELVDKLSRATMAQCYEYCPLCDKKLRRYEWKYCAECQKEEVANGEFVEKRRAGSS